MPPTREALDYLASRLSVIPLAPGTKKALGPWQRYESERMSPKAARRIFSAKVGIAIVGGEGSDGLIIFDADDDGLVRWLRRRHEQLKKLWCVETGSHKLHLYARTKGDLETDVVKAGKTHLGEIRGHGSYVVAPPTKVDEEDHDQTYKTLWGSPGSIPTLKDAKAFFHSLVGSYAKTLHTSKPTATRDPHEIIPPLTGKAKHQLYDRINECPDLDAGTKRIIFKGVKDEGFASNSHADYGIMHGLVIAGFTAGDIERVFATYSIGEKCYRNRTRPGSYGWGYIRVTADSVNKHINEEEDEAEEAHGENFQIVAVKKKLYDEPVFELYVTGSSKGEVRCECVIDDILSEGRLRKVLSLGLSFVPKFTTRGKNFTKLSDAILRLAVDELVPEEAKGSGQIRAFVADRLKSKSQMLPDIPTDEHRVSLGWVNEKNGHVYARGGRLFQLAAMALRPTPSPEHFWAVVSGMGGEEVQHTFADTGSQERVWSIPKLPLGIKEEE